VHTGDGTTVQAKQTIIKLQFEFYNGLTNPENPLGHLDRNFNPLN